MMNAGVSAAFQTWLLFASLAQSLARLLGVVLRVLETPRRHGEAPQSQGGHGDEKADEGIIIAGV